MCNRNTRILFSCCPWILSGSRSFYRASTLQSGFSLCCSFVLLWVALAWFSWSSWSLFLLRAAPSVNGSDNPRRTQVSQAPTLLIRRIRLARLVTTNHGAHHRLHASRKCNDTSSPRLSLPYQPPRGSHFFIAGVGTRSAGVQSQL